MGNRGQCAGGAGADHHGVRRIGAAGDRCEPFFAAKYPQPDVVRALHPGQQSRASLVRAAGQPQAQFLLRHDLRSLRIQQADFQVVVQQAVKQSQAVGQAGGTGQGKGQATRGHHRDGFLSAVGHR